MMLLAIDPAPAESAYVLWDGSKLCEFGKVTNAGMLDIISRPTAAARCVIEQVCCYGMPVGAEIFETVFWSGRFSQAFGAERVDRIPRREVKLHCCGNCRAKDTNIRQYLIDRFGTHGGNKKQGMLCGVKADVWQALALAVTWWDRNSIEERAV